MSTFGSTIPGWGVDLRKENRPGVPQERSPRPMGNPPYATPEQQHNGRPTAIDVLRPQPHGRVGAC